jgi:Short C-terminal domain
MNETASRTGRWRTPVARLLTVLGVLLIVISIAANFVERQALDADEFEETARQLAADETIQAQVAATLTESLFTNVDVQAALEQRLPPEQQGLAGPLAGALRPVAERLALRLLDRPRFQELWVEALSVSQQQVVRILDDEARFIETEQGVVAIDLRPLLVELTDQLEIVPDLSDRLPEDAGLITIFEAEELERAQQATRFLRFVADWIWVFALACWVGAVFLARDRRREVRAIAVGFVAVGLLVLALRRVAGRYLVDRLTETSAQEDAVANTWAILTRLLADAGWAAIGLGIVALLGVWLVGPGRRGTALRGWLAPYLRRPEIAFGGAALLFLALLVWGPIAYVERPLTILALAVLAALGVEFLRRKAEGDFPDAVASGISLPVLGRGGGKSTAGELERLAQLKQQGLLSDEEYVAAKAQLLGSGRPVDTPDAAP